MRSQKFSESLFQPTGLSEIKILCIWVIDFLLWSWFAVAWRCANVIYATLGAVELTSVLYTECLGVSSYFIELYPVIYYVARCCWRKFFSNTRSEKNRLDTRTNYLHVELRNLRYNSSVKITTFITIQSWKCV